MRSNRRANKRACRESQQVGNKCPPKGEIEDILFLKEGN